MIEVADSEADEDEEVGNSVVFVYPHPIGGTRDAGGGSCCAGCQERCCGTTTHRGGDGRRLASQFVH